MGNVIDLNNSTFLVSVADVVGFFVLILRAASGRLLIKMENNRGEITPPEAHQS